MSKKIVSIENLKKIGNAEEFLPLINLLCSSEGAILAGSSISADACESKAYNFN